MTCHDEECVKVLVVGAGVAGLTTALELARRGSRRWSSSAGSRRHGHPAPLP
jgi:glycine/D-amino acid oxidase-like deaminating enzyme